VSVYYSSAGVTVDTEPIGLCMLYICLCLSDLWQVLVGTSAGDLRHYAGRRGSASEHGVQDFNWERLDRSRISRRQVPTCKYDCLSLCNHATQANST